MSIAVQAEKPVDLRIRQEEKLFGIAALGTGLIWLGLLSLLFFVVGDPLRIEANLKTLWIFGVMSLFNLLAMTKTVANLLKLRSSADQDFIPTYRMKTVVWGLAKLGSLAAFMGLFLWVKRNPEGLSEIGALAGMSILLMVPVVGGLIWNKLR